MSEPKVDVLVACFACKQAEVFLSSTVPGVAWDDMTGVDVELQSLGKYRYVVCEFCRDLIKDLRERGHTDICVLRMQEANRRLYSVGEIDFEKLVPLYEEVLAEEKERERRRRPALKVVK